MNIPSKNLRLPFMRNNWTLDDKMDCYDYQKRFRDVSLFYRLRCFLFRQPRTYITRMDMVRHIVYHDFSIRIDEAERFYNWFIDCSSDTVGINRLFYNGICTGCNYDVLNVVEYTLYTEFHKEIENAIY